MSEPNNPFSALVAPATKTEKDKNAEQRLVNTLIENVFFFTISQDSLRGPPQLVFLEEMETAERPRARIDLDSLEQALFERLLMRSPESQLAPHHRSSPNPNVVETRVLIYLFISWQHLQNYVGSRDDTLMRAARRMRELILRNAVTALKQPALFDGQNLAKQLLEVFNNNDETSRSFFLDIIAAFVADDDGSDPYVQLKEAVTPFLRELTTEINKYNLINLPLYILPVVQIFASNPHLATILIESCEPRPTAVPSGQVYQESVLGALLMLSPLPANGAPSRGAFFHNPNDHAAVSIMETSLWNASKHLTENLHKTFLTLLKAGPVLRDKTLSWIGKCLKENKARGQLWNIQGGELNVAPLVSDGFMLNLGTVLLRLCEPFCSTFDDPKSLKIDPTYCAVPPAECEGKSVHLVLHEETCLLPALEAEDGSAVARPTALTYNFLTDCFFLAHKCIDLGMRVCAEKLLRLGQEISPMQQSLENIDNPELLQAMQRRLRPYLTKYVSLWCALTEPESLSLLSRLHTVTCNWLVQLAVHPQPAGDSPPATYAPLTQLPVVMPIAVPTPDTLRCVPEFVLENVVVFVSVVRRSSPRSVPVLSDAELVALYSPALTLVITYMGDARRVYNPHLRARLAECLEGMLPDSGTSSLSTFYREQLFKDHPHRRQLVRCLLDVFVGIEMTGQSVQFEQKFNYRRPMYLVMDFLWAIEEHRDCFTELAREAEANMEAVQPPLFLRFVNLLMNDAIFLLDEALSNMSQIRTMQAQQAAGEWASMSVEDRTQNMSNFNHASMRARYENILGRDTTRTLVRMTAHAPYVFCHPTLVDRVASMLNYFLLNLTGPNKKNFKVKNGEKYQFDPANTVLDICRMYVELGGNERFCAAVSDDGRSYSPQLFSQADAVLVRIGGGGLIVSLQEVAARVAELAARRRADEVALADAPDDFLDPIMSTLMLDPVVLPSSHTTLDRTTIARHLLSDQSDPFNRSPLTMDQVIPNVELRERIHAWVAERRRHSAADDASTG